MLVGGLARSYSPLHSSRRREDGPGPVCEPSSPAGPVSLRLLVAVELIERLDVSGGTDLEVGLMPGLEETFRQFPLPIHNREPVGFEQVPVSAAAAKFLPLTDQRFEHAANRVFGDCLIVGMLRWHK